MSENLPSGRRAELLLDEARRKALSFVPKEDVDGFAGLYAEAARMNHLATLLELPEDENFDFMVAWLDEELNIGQSRDGWRSGQVVDMERAKMDEDIRAEQYMSPEYTGGKSHGWKR